MLQRYSVGTRVEEGAPAVQANKGQGAAAQVSRRVGNGADFERVHELQLVSGVRLQGTARRIIAQGR